MTSYGYTLSSEEHGPLDLVRNAHRAEEAGFEFLTVSDHFHPWTQSQGHSPFAWTTVGGVAATTRQVALGTGVTCPLQRYHPAIVAQAAATAAAMMPGRFFLGVGTGEALNEHVLGDRWPVPEVRLEMLEEAIDVMRALWEGETVDHWGLHYTVENARIFTLPDEPPPIVVAAASTGSAELAGRAGDGLWSTHPDREVVDAYRSTGGTGPVYGQVTLCWARDEDKARRTVKEIWPNAGVPGQLSQDLPTWTHFEQAAQLVTEEKLAERVPCGPDAGPVVEAVQQFVEAGFTHVHLHQVGRDQDGFFTFWERELRSALP